MALMSVLGGNKDLFHDRVFDVVNTPITTNVNSYDCILDLIGLYVNSIHFMDLQLFVSLYTVKET